MEQQEFIKRGQRAPFVKWSEPGVEYEGVVLWTNMAPDYVFGTREPKLDDDGNEVQQMLVCIEGEDSQWVIPIRYGSNLHSRVANAITETGATTLEPGGFLRVRFSEQMRNSLAKLFEVQYEPPNSVIGDGRPQQPTP